MGKKQKIEDPGYISIKEIADYFSVTTATVRNWLNKYNIFADYYIRIECGNRKPIYRCKKSIIKKIEDTIIV